MKKQQQNKTERIPQADVHDEAEICETSLLLPLSSK